MAKSLGPTSAEDHTTTCLRHPRQQKPRRCRGQRMGSPEPPALYSPHHHHLLPMTNGATVCGPSLVLLCRSFYHGELMGGQVSHHFQQQKDGTVYRSPKEQEGGRDGDARNEPRGGEREQGTCSRIIFSICTNIARGMNGAAALPWRNSTWLEADNRKLTMCGADVSEVGSRAEMFLK